MKKLSPAQQSALRYALKHSRVQHMPKGDVCMNALRRKGYAEYNNNLGSTHSRASWWITDAGMEVAKQLLGTSPLTRPKLCGGENG